MPKFSVKKPLTIFVAVIAVLVLGVVAFFKMTPDLLPNMDFPYVVVVTTYPGASPEKVESEVTKPMEQAMSTLEHIIEVSSTSSENYSMILMEFEDSVNMDTIGVDIQQEITTLSAQWDDMVGTPYVLKINPSLLPVAVAAVSMEGMDTVELTTFLNETLMNKLEGVSGVAQITTSGMIEQELHVVLDQNRIDELNDKIADAINGQIDDAAAELEEKKQELEDAQNEMANAKDQLDSGKSQLAQQMAEAESMIGSKQNELLATKAQLSDQLVQLQSGKSQLESILSILQAVQSGLKTLSTEAEAIGADLKILLSLEASAEALEELKAQFEAQIEEIKNSGMSQDEIDAAIEELKNSAAYQEMLAQLEILEAQLAARGLDIESLKDAIEEKQAALDRLQTKMEELKETLNGQDVSADMLDETIAEMEGNLSQIAAGEKALNDAMKQLDSGMIQLQDAEKVLNQQKTEGLLEISSAAAELAIGNATITNAMTQIESGFDTIEDSRESALEQADLNGIISMDMISQILMAQNFSMPAGYVEQDGVSYMVSVGDEITEQAALENLLLFDLGMDGIEPIYLSDVAAVFMTDNRNETYAKLNGDDGIVLTFEKQSTASTAGTTDNIEERFRELEEEFPGLTFVSLMNQGDYIYMIVESILSSLLLGAVFAIIVLFVFLKDLRPTFITLCAIPISVIFAIVLMYFSGVTINMISLSGLAVAVGMLVDNSVVVIENIYRLRSKGANVIQAAVSGAAQVAGAVTSSTLTTVCVFLPIVFVTGVTKQLFTDLALTMTYSLMASLIVSLTLVPAMASGMLRKEKKTRDRVMEWLMPIYEKTVSWSLGHKAVILIAAVVLLVSTAAISLARGFIFMPTMDMSSLTVTITMPEDATMEDAVAYSDEVLERIETVDGIASSGAMMSSSGLGMLSGGGGAYDITVYITLEDINGSGAAVGKEIEALCADMDCTITASSAMMDMSMLTGSGISMNIYSNDMDSLQTAAREAAAVLDSIEGVGEVSDGLEDAAPALHIAVDRNKAMGKGITVAQVYMEIAAALTESSNAATLELDGTSTSIVIEKPETSKIDVDGLKDYTFEVTGRDGTVNTFALSDIAEVEETTSLNSISRIAQRRYLSVTADVEEGYNVTTLTSEAERAMKKADLGEEVTYSFSGENEAIMEAVKQLGLMLLLGVLLVYLVMVAQFQSLKSPFIVMFTIPLAFTGGFLALLICGMEVSVVSLIGFVMLVGIIVNNGIVLVDYINQLRQDGRERRAAIIEAGTTRMRPILMTTITTILGLLDMAVRKNVGTAMVQPIAVVCIGGLVYATLMTLFVVPCIYDMLNKKELRSVREEDLRLLDI